MLCSFNWQEFKHAQFHNLKAGNNTQSQDCNKKKAEDGGEMIRLEAESRDLQKGAKRLPNVWLKDVL